VERRYCVYEKVWSVGERWRQESTMCIHALALVGHHTLISSRSNDVSAKIGITAETVALGALSV